MKNLITTLLLLFTVNTFVQAQTYKSDEGTAIFHSEVPLHTFSGTSNYLTGLVNLEDGTVDFYLDLTTLDTGIEKRDRDMKETLETGEYPFAEFFGTLQTEFNPDTTAQQAVKVKGDFKIHGVSHEVTIDGTLQMKPEGLMVTANWVLQLEDYDIVPPSLLFVKVDQEQKIEIEALLKPVEE
jgi:polyisoprenoid-binding protein YceI